MQKADSASQAKDTGLAIVLICLLLIRFARYDFLLLPAIVVLVTTMTWPGVFTPLARIWFGFSGLLGGVMSKVLLTVVFYGVVAPVGILRRLCGSDPMRIRAWKEGKHSVFKEREYIFARDDLEKPY